MSAYPVFLGAVILTSENNRIRFREAAGAVGNVDIPAGTYYLRGDGSADDLCLALKTGLDAFGGGGNAYSVTVAFSVEAGVAHTRITVTRTSGSSTFGIVVDGSTTFDMDLIGFPASTANDSAAKTSTQACAAAWASNDAMRENEPVSRRVASVRQVASGGVRGVSRSARMQDFRVGLSFVLAERMQVEEALSCDGDTLEGFIERFGAGAAFEFHRTTLSGTALGALSSSTLRADAHFAEETVTSFDPVRLAVGTALYAIDLRLHKQVTP